MIEDNLILSKNLTVRETDTDERVILIKGLIMTKELKIITS
jgi:hypothetical protein